MTFIDDWKRQFPKLWSVRFSLLAALLSGIEVGMQEYFTGKTPLIAAGAGLFSLGAALARVISQPGMVSK
uniref:Holin n=1 Tax=Pseudomonas phage Touem01 TaxID=3138548 RepID=A0AAU6W2M7_9VIRU